MLQATVWGISGLEHNDSMSTTALQTYDKNGAMASPWPRDAGRTKRNGGADEEELRPRFGLAAKIVSRH